MNILNVEKFPDTGLYVGYIPGFPGVHSQGIQKEIVRLEEAVKHQTALTKRVIK